MLSLSINIVFCVSATVISANHSGYEYSLNTLSTLCNTSFIPPPVTDEAVKAMMEIDKTLTLFLFLLTCIPLPMQLPSPLLCRAKYSLLATVLHPATRCSTVSLNSRHSQHLPFSISPLATFHPLVSTICSIIVIIDAVFPGVNLCFNQRWHSCSCLLYKSLCNSFCS